MQKFLIITKIPSRQGMLGPIKGINVIDETEAVDVDALRKGLHIPLDGECLIVPMEHVTTIKPRLVNEVV